MEIMKREDKGLRAVIFDMDGVLLDSEKLYCRFWMEAAREAGYDWQMEHSLRMRSLSAEYAAPLVREMFDEHFDYHAVRERRKALMNAYLEIHPIEMKAGVRETLLRLRTMGYKTAVATATDRERTGRYLGQAGLTDLFDEIVCTAMVAHGKPAPDVYLYAAAAIGERPECCLAVEDSPNGILAASRAGLKPVMAVDLSEPGDELQSLLYGCIHSLPELLELL